MRHIIVDIVKRYAWECPQCGCYNVQEDCDDLVECEDCCQEFKVEGFNDII